MMHQQVNMPQFITIQRLFQFLREYNLSHQELVYQNKSYYRSLYEDLCILTKQSYSFLNLKDNPDIHPESEKRLKNNIRKLRVHELKKLTIEDLEFVLNWCQCHQKSNLTEYRLAFHNNKFLDICAISDKRRCIKSENNQNKIFKYVDDEEDEMFKLDTPKNLNNLKVTDFTYIIRSRKTQSQSKQENQQNKSTDGQRSFQADSKIKIEISQLQNSENDKDNQESVDNEKKYELIIDSGSKSIKRNSFQRIVDEFLERENSSNKDEQIQGQQLEEEQQYQKEKKQLQKEEEQQEEEEQEEEEKQEEEENQEEEQKEDEEIKEEKEQGSVSYEVQKSEQYQEEGKNIEYIYQQEQQQKELEQQYQQSLQQQILEFKQEVEDQQSNQNDNKKLIQKQFTHNNNQVQNANNDHDQAFRTIIRNKIQDQRSSNKKSYQFQVFERNRIKFD